MRMPRSSAPPGPRLDPHLPVFDVHEHHEATVDAPASVTWEAVQQMDIRQSRLIRAIFTGREWLMGSRADVAPPAGPFLQELRTLGWRPLEEEPGCALVMGAATQPWLADVTFRGMAPEAFVAFNEPGFAKIAWSLVVEPLGPGRSRLVTETRVATTDADARRRFRRYWWLVSPGIRLIRRQVLALVKAAAERRAAG